MPGLANYIPYAFNLTSVPQRQLNNRPTSLVTGAVVGGSSAINGMFIQRAPARDYDAFIELGNPGWGFKDLLPYFKKAGQSPFDACERVLIRSRVKISPLPKRNLQRSFPSHGMNLFMVPVDQSRRVTRFLNSLPLVRLTSVRSQFRYYLTLHIENFFAGWRSLGVKSPRDPASGDSTGAFFGPGSLDPKDETRSYARTAHYNRVIKSRPNYHLLTGHAVSKVIFSGKKASGVQVPPPLNPQHFLF